MAKRGFFPGWKVVAGSGVGIAFGSVVFFSQGFALLSAAIGAQFGWSQSELARAATIFLLLQMAMYPVCGRFLDRWGSRKFAMASIVLFAVSLAVLSQIANSLPRFYLAFMLIGLVSAGTNVVSYARAITHWFDRKRGLALGFAASCQAVGAFLIPVFMQKIIAHSGWPTALLVLAALELVVCLPIVALWVKDSPAPYGLRPDGDVSSPSVATTTHMAPGLEFGDVVRNPTFWKLAIAFAVVGMSFFAVNTNVAFILTGTAGLSLGQIATIQGLAGVATLFGRIGFGYLLDRLHAPVVGAISVLLTAVYFTIYATSSAEVFIAMAAILGGFAIGGEGDLMPYLASRYFGSQAVSKLFGWFLFSFFVGAAIGPVAFARASAIFNGAVVPLYMLAALQAVPAILFLSVGPYRTPAAAGTPPKAITAIGNEKLSSRSRS